MSPSHSPSPSPQHQHFSPKSAPAPSPSLPPLNTGHPSKRSPLPRPPSYAKNRMSTYSTQSRRSEARSRPMSNAFPLFHSSLPYTLVRDFAYPPDHPLHYGPPPEPSEAPSGNSTPASERHMRMLDPSNGAWDGDQQHWSEDAWGGDGQQLPQTAYGDGPPYSEDEDLHSPVVASRHKKHKSPLLGLGHRNGKGKAKGPGDDHLNEGDFADSTAEDVSGEHRYLAGVNGDGTATYYIRTEDESANGPGGGLVTYPPDQVRQQSLLAPKVFRRSQAHRDSHFAALPDRTLNKADPDNSDDDTESGILDEDDSRYSRDYQFTIASPDEEMHGKAVALFDFARENENELPLVEGQIIWVSYRHGQGWLVAEDPKTGDAGLVPEEYVRLLRDIEGGWSSLAGELSPSPPAPASAEEMPTSPSQAYPEPVSSPTQPSNNSQPHLPHSGSQNNGKSEKRPPIVSTFSTSSKDLDRYPHQLTQAGATPPTVVHQSQGAGQTSTPIASPPIVVGKDSEKEESASQSDTDESTEEDEKR